MVITDSLVVLKLADSVKESKQLHLASQVFLLQNNGYSCWVSILYANWGLLYGLWQNKQQIVTALEKMSSTTVKLNWL